MFLLDSFSHWITPVARPFFRASHADRRQESLLVISARTAKPVCYTVSLGLIVNLGARPLLWLESSTRLRLVLDLVFN